MTAEPRPRVLVVDDQAEMARMLCDGLSDHGYDALPAASGKEALARLEGEPFDALLTDLRMPDVDGLALLQAARRLAPELPVIVMTAYSAIDTAVESIRRGAYHYLTKPFKLDELLIFLGRALDERAVRREASDLRSVLGEGFGRARLIGRSRAMQRVLAVLERVVDTDTALLFGGETGTGKGLLARAVHGESRRRDRPFVTVNCAALPEALLESELFGHEKGAFTGATHSHRGLFAEADGGTLFLDEIGDLPLALQAKLLRVLDEGVLRPLGSSREQRPDVRIIAATHLDLREAVHGGAFRADLFYRLDVVSLVLPPLRERREDLPAFIDHFLRLHRARHPPSRVERFAAPALERLLEYPWPGNVRELGHTIERAVLLARGPEVDLDELPAALQAPPASAAKAPLFAGEVMPIRELQHRYAAWALQKLGGHRGRTADRLGVDAKTLAKWLKDE